MAMESILGPVIILSSPSDNHVIVSEERYEGQWKKGEKHGMGTYYYAYGDKYHGEWVNGEKSGRGTLTYSNGAKYEGQWKNNMAHGKGIFSYTNG